MSHIALEYGSASVATDLVAPILFAATLPGLPDPEEEIRRALAAPISSPQLADIVRPGEGVVIVTSDITRYTGSEIYLPILVEELNRCGIGDDDIEIVVALGIHRKQSAEEHRKILGPLYGRINVYVKLQGQHAG